MAFEFPDATRLLVPFILVLVFSGCTRESPAPEIIDPITELISAANSGDVAAQARLGWLHENGQAVPLSFEQAFNWYLMAAMQGDYWTIAKVGRMYFPWGRRTAGQEARIRMERLGGRSRK